MNRYLTYPMAFLMVLLLSGCNVIVPPTIPDGDTIIVGDRNQDNDQDNRQDNDSTTETKTETNDSTVSPTPVP